MIAELTMDLAELRNLEEDDVIVLLGQDWLGGLDVCLDASHHLDIDRKWEERGN